MSKNRLKPAPKPARRKARAAQRRWPHRWLAILQGGFTADLVPRLLFLVGLGILYIANSHQADRSYRRLARLRAQVEELRVDYTTLKAHYMYASKQSEVARRVAPLGLEESVSPPQKVVLRTEE